MSTPSTPSTPASESADQPPSPGAAPGGPGGGRGREPGGEPAAAPATPTSRYSLGSFPNMFRSMLVIALFVLALVAIVPRISQVQRPAVDAAGKASQVAAQTTWRIQLPRSLGAGWAPTVAPYGPGTEQVPTFTTVWTTPSGADIALKQAVGATPGWVARSVNDGQATGTVTVSGRTFEKFVAGDARQLSYVVRGQGPKGLTLVASGTAPEDELNAFVAALAPVTRAAGVTP